MKKYSICKYRVGLPAKNSDIYLCRKKKDCGYKTTISGTLEGDSLTLSFCHKEPKSNKSLENRVNKNQ